MKLRTGHSVALLLGILLVVATWMSSGGTRFTQLGLTPEPSPWQLPVRLSWPAAGQWDDRREEEYAEFIERLGQAVAARRCGRLDTCLRSPEANLLYEPGVDGRLSLEVDCGDLPYILRGYFAFKRRLPFGFVCEVRGQGRDLRYMSQVEPTRWCSWQGFATPRAVLVRLTGLVHSWVYRMAPEVEESDFYPAAVDRRAIRPGTVYYDPNGHVLVVVQVRDDGQVYLIDGHPDGTLTWRRFGQSYALGGRGQGGGFKNFRPQRLVNGAVVRARDSELPFVDAQAQWQKDRWLVAGQPAGYHAFVRAALATSSAPVDPVQDFREQVRALCRDVSDRAEAVELAVEAGLPRRPHPGELPWNIYGASGDWEIYATPSRDARLKAAFRELRGVAAAAAPTLLPALARAWLDEIAQPGCTFAYVNSAGGQVSLGLPQVLQRLFALSFDPYHCPELRWGAPEGTQEASTCPSDPAKRDLYLREARLRHRIERVYGVPTPLDAGPEVPEDVDVQRVLGLAP